MYTADELLDCLIEMCEEAADVDDIQSLDDRLNGSDDDLMSRFHAFAEQESGDE